MPIRPLRRSDRALPAPPAAGARILVRTSVPLPPPTDRCVDVRPGAVASFDGDRIRLALAVTHRESRATVDWADSPALEATLASALRGGTTTLRFGDRRAVRTALGAARADALERRLGTTATDLGATLVVWTSAARREGDHHSYDLVVDGPGTRVG